MQDQRGCPGRTGKKCGVFMLPLIRDPHILAPVAVATSVPLTILVLFASPGHRSSGTYLQKRSPMLILNLGADALYLWVLAPPLRWLGLLLGGRLSPPASPPPSRDQVVMGGQPSASVNVSCLGSAPSGSITLATGYVSDDAVPASPVPPPASGGEGGRRSYPALAPPSPARVPAVFSRLGGERSVWIHLAPHSLAIPALPLRREAAR